MFWSASLRRCWIHREPGEENKEVVLLKVCNAVRIGSVSECREYFHSILYPQQLRVMLAFDLIVDGLYDLQIHGLPKILLFKHSAHNIYYSHVVLSHRIQDASQIIEFTGIWNFHCSLEGFGTEHHTLTIGFLHSGWLVPACTWRFSGHVCLFKSVVRSRTLGTWMDTIYLLLGGFTSA